MSLVWGGGGVYIDWCIIMVLSISSCFVWNSKGELQLGYSKFSLLFKDEFYPLLITVFVPDATKTGSCVTSLDQGRDNFPTFLPCYIYIACNVQDLHFLEKTCDSAHILIYFFLVGKTFDL